MRRKYNDLLAKRAGMLTEAETLLKDGKREDYKSKMAEIGNINDEITEVKAFIDEQDRQFLERKDDPGEEKDKAAERGNTLMKGGSIALSAQEVRKGLYLASKSVTLATTTLVEPTGAGRNIRDGIGNMVSSIIDQVYVQDLTGMGSFLEPYVISELDAKGGKVSTNAGKARTASSDPTFGVAKISAYELNTTSYVDRNISRLSPAGYYDKIYGMALRAMRRKACGLIANGDGQASPDMYGIKNAKKFKSVQTGGPSGGCLTEKHLDTPIDYDNLLASGSMMGSGGMIVMDEDDCMVSVAKFYLEFTVEESCGKCTPCRIGNKRLLEILDRITKGKGTEEDLTELKNLAGVIRDSSLCALGQTAPNPVLSTMDNFWDEYVAHVRDKSCPAHQCRDLMSYVIDPKVCKGCSLCSRVCPTNAISGVLKQPYSIDQTVCIKCGTCMDKCKFGAISVR